MKAIILAAGRGSRMGSLTDKQPKCLTVIRSKRLIEHQIDALTEAGIKEIAVVTGYKAEALQHYGTYHFHNSRWNETNMVASLLCAKSWMDESDCIISYSDIFYGAQIVRDLMICKNDIAVAYDVNWFELWSKRFENPMSDAESFRLDDNGYITEIGEKPISLEVIQGQYIGLLKFKSGVFSDCLIKTPDANFDEINMTRYLSKLIQKLQKIKAVSNSELWGEVDSCTDIKCYEIGK